MVTNMWEELYKQHYQELLRKAVCICRNSAQAEDAVQETFLRALQNVSVVEDLGPSQRRAWLFRALKKWMREQGDPGVEADTEQNKPANRPAPKTVRP